jgi:hypothetical protein
VFFTSSALTRQKLDLVGRDPHLIDGRADFNLAAVFFWYVITIDQVASLAIFLKDWKWKEVKISSVIG